VCRGVLHLAARTSESDVEILIFNAAYKLVRKFSAALVPQVNALALDLGIYDGLAIAAPSQ
jgi:hypothetical protein